MEIISTLILILPVLILVLSPIILYLIRRRKQKKSSPDEQGSQPPAEEQPVKTAAPIRPKQVFKRTEQVQYTAPTMAPPEKPAAPQGSPSKKIDALPRLKRAVLWAEILGPPRSLKE